ncbi:hypothetical protein AAFF_G00271050 [Aldrovandia affinis]|uniref:Uncharacterized protein n=1 Tax=Aldrovandia affinis TaxID=143900 RepID=A0AAD7W2E4_9TELE|nr:hypothetical protein AAFF_G00271050 [Aldrovandia affinis]
MSLGLLTLQETGGRQDPSILPLSQKASSEGTPQGPAHPRSHHTGGGARDPPPHPAPPAPSQLRSLALDPVAGEGPEPGWCSKPLLWLRLRRWVTQWKL